MKSEFSVAGKTFVAGEYLALLGGPALVLSTEPRFRLVVETIDERRSGAGSNPFHPESPAGQLWSAYPQFFSRYQITFFDPYAAGGFGASSAQFALLHAFWQLKESAFTESERFFDWHEMLLDYRNLALAQGFAPSGADVVGVCAGGFTWFDRNNGKLQTFAWPFSEIDFYLAHTGRKLPTHEHLQKLGEFSGDGLELAMREIQVGLEQVNFGRFLGGLRRYRALLEDHGWVAEFTAGVVRELEQNPTILFAKGCGAMGADVVLVLAPRGQARAVGDSLNRAGLRLVADTSRISSGLLIQSAFGQEVVL